MIPAEGDAEQTIRREATIAALIEAQDVSISDDEMVAAIAEDMNEGDEKAKEQLDAIKEAGGIKQLENELKGRKVIDEVVSKAKAIPFEQAEARDAIWTPEKEEEAAAAPKGEGLWTPGS